MYALFMRRIARGKKWDIATDPKYEPTLSIMIPTYEEGATILRKLDNVAEVEYPREKLDVNVVDSASTDDTVSLVLEWARLHPEIRTRVICEKERKGMVHALNYGLGYLNGEIVVKTDADCLWATDSLRNAVKYLADPKIGSVAGLNSLQSRKETLAVKTEKTYRGIYNWLRIGESKLYSSVLYEGELMLLKRRVIEAIGFDEDIGADDLPTAIRLTENGYRAIVVDDAFYFERTPHSWREKFQQKIRRGRHILQGLWKYKRVMFKKKTVFHRVILPFETYIYIVNPLITIPLFLSSVAIVVRYPWSLLLASVLLIPQARDAFAAYIINNLIMVLSVFMEIGSREKVTWHKTQETREV
jgi:cellulose synthase/poly-beta-1,6-N-acetylglucosamine synthase-like glycosyltransferase